ncbi:MAG: hypothetical protein PUB18_01180 [bacterium]|nr:hypothetical protein [bacterium]
MNGRESYFANFSTSSLFVLLEQNLAQLTNLELKQTTNDHSLLKNRIFQLQFAVSIIRSILIDRYLKEKISLTQIANYLLWATGIREDVYQELFTLKLLESDEFIELTLLEKAIHKLDMEKLMAIIQLKEDTIYGTYAVRRYDEMIFDVEEDVFEEYVKKIKFDEKEE